MTKVVPTSSASSGDVSNIDLIAPANFKQVVAIIQGLTVTNKDYEAALKGARFFVNNEKLTPHFSPFVQQAAYESTTTELTVPGTKKLP